VGSGTGYFAAEMKNAGWLVTGLEPDDEARRMAAEIHGIQPDPVQELFDLPQNSFDMITLWHVLEHVHELKRYIKQFRDLLKENGKLFVAVPNYESHDAKVYKEYWAAYDVPRHLYHFTPNSMKQLMETAGLKVVSIKPMWFDSFYVSLLSSKYKNGSTNWPGALWTGLRSNMKAIANVRKCSSVIYIIGK
jgi:2-polyprenyl-3-methyl-5-hydroxy-6-metoxy-1,4-benzoquinol methylase